MSDAVTSPRPELTLAGARRVLDAALAHAAEVGVAVCLHVVDRAGEPIVSARMDGAPRLSMGVAADKAYTVTGFNGLPTERWWSLIGEDPPVLAGLTKQPRFSVLGGGLPVIVDGDLVGAIGVSGGSVAQDVEIATAGIDALT